MKAFLRHDMSCSPSRKLAISSGASGIRKSKFLQKHTGSSQGRAEEQYSPFISSWIVFGDVTSDRDCQPHPRRKYHPLQDKYSSGSGNNNHYGSNTASFRLDIDVCPLSE